MLTDRSRRKFHLCSSLAIATALVAGAGSARAQSFLANSTTTFGNAVVTTGANTTTITVNSPSAVIDWTPFDTATSPLAITYQPNGTTATFTSTGNFAVLNRIVPVDPTRAIAFDGIVNSLVGGSPGGTVFFYSPGGIFLSPNAQFNVGNLGLTSSAPVVDGTGNWYTGNQVQFQTSAAGRFVNTLVGAQINAPAEGSYVALVAPVIDQRGTINVNGAAALVSADAATVTFNPSGLFDIQVTSGTSGNLGGTNATLFNSGAITGPASSGAGDNHRIYAVAVPKNTAITLAIAQGGGNQLGFNIAGAADVAGNAVVLSAGKDIVGGNIAATRSAGGGTGAADLNIANSTVTSSLRGASTDETFFFSVGGGTASAAATVNLQADNRATFTAEGTGSTTTANGMVTLNADRFGSAVTGGQVDIFAIDNGQVTITTGGAMLSANAIGSGGASPGSVGGVATGGLALVQALTGGDVVITGPVAVTADAFGGIGNAAAGGGATGGQAQVTVRDAGSSLTITGTSLTRAIGVGGNGATGFAGGTGAGGLAIVNAQTATSSGIAITGATTISAVGFGGAATNGTAGNGLGGQAVLAASVNNGIQLGSTVDIFGVGQGGNSTGGAAGSGTGGTARINLFDGGVAIIGGNTKVLGVGVTGNAGAAGTAIGAGGLGAVTVQSNAALDITGNLEVSGAGLGGLNPAMTPGVGAGVGGTANVAAFTNGSIEVSGVLRARAPGTAANGQNAQGGTVNVSATSGGDVTTNELSLDAGAIGGADTGTGSGSGTGGTANLSVGGAGSTLTVNNGNSTGVMANGELEFVTAQGFGGQNNGGGSGIGGTGTGGTISLNVTNGAVLTGPATTGTPGAVRILARGTGGNADTGAIAGGNATGGTITINVDNATMTSATLLPSSFSQGGSATLTATGTINGGNTVGGTRDIRVLNGGSLTASLAGGTAGGQGGNATALGRGGDASGGSARLDLDNNATLTTNGNFSVFSINSPGAGLNGGNATGGTAFVRIANGSTINQTGPVATTNFSVQADALGSTPTGPSTGSAGTLTAGSATMIIENSTVNLRNLIVSANANGGAPQFYAQGSNATAGTAILQFNGGTLTAESVGVAANGLGGSIAAGQTGGTAGIGTGGTARLNAFGGTVAINSTQFISVTGGGVGGNMEGAGAATGAGIGGTGLIFINGGAAVTLTSIGVAVEADGEGGETINLGTANIGGDGTAGTAEVFVTGGSLVINGDLDLEADNDGGDGTQGGNGLLRAGGTPNALIHAQNGSITVNGDTDVGSQGDGASSLNGGGVGGTGNGGFVVIEAQNSLAGPSTITLNGDVLLDASAFGGQGDGASGGNGGDGGDAFGGQAQIFGNAGNGTLIVNGTLFANAIAVGGDGALGTSSSGVGGQGGIGGDATGGFIQIGTRSGTDTGAVNTGSATFDAIQAMADATGGTGGNGGAGGTAQGFGGPGGSASGGGAGILVRGSVVNLTSPVAVSLSGDAIGGDGGAGSTQGVGGTARVGDNGGVFVTASSRFMQPTQRGTLNAGGIFGSAVATGGAGSVAGASLVGNQPISVLFDSSDGNVDTISFNATGTIVSGTIPSQLAVINGTLNVSDTLSLSTSGDLAVTLDTSTVNVANLALNARSFVLSGPLDTARYGTFNVDNGLILSSLGDVLINANFAADFGATLSVNGSLLVGSLDFDGDVEIDATGGIATRAITANGTIDLASGTNTVTGALTATDSVFVNSAGDLIVAGPVSAGIVNPLPNAPDGYTIGLRSLTSVVAGNLAAAGSVGLASPGTISVGTIASGIHVLGLAGTGFTSGAITTPQPTTGTIPQIYIANFSMETQGGQVGPNFNPLPIFAVTNPIIPINGPVAINGAVATGSIRAASTSTVSVGGPISTSFSVGLNGAQGVSIGTFVNTAFTPAAINAGIGINLTSTAGSVRAGALTAGDSIGITGSTGVTLGDASAGLAQAANFNNYKLFITSNAGSVASGALFARNDLGIQASGTLTTGALRGRDVLLLIGGAVSTGGITAVPNTQQQTQPSGRIYLGNFSMATPTVNVTQQFATQGIVNLFNTLPPVKIGGAVTISGPSSGRSLLAATTQNFTAGNIALAPSQFFSNGIQVDAGGTLVVNGAWTADFMTLRSNDIDIPANGSLAGFVELISTNTILAAIGDFSSSAPNQPPAGAYRLTDAEFDRISGGFDFEARDNTAAVDILVGDLSVDATRFTSTSEGGEIAVEDDIDDDLRVGRIRIDGNVTVTGASRDSFGEELFGISFDSQSFELNAATGSLTIADSTGGLAGSIEIEADNIHVASDDILIKLRADPFYSGHVRELNAPARVQRPDGVLRAANLELEGDKTIYIQNTGSAAVPAGFVAKIGQDDEEGTSIGPEEDPATGQTYKIVINGQIQTSTGLLTGSQAFQAAVDQAKADAIADGDEFAAGLDPTSTFNNCVVLTGVCSVSSSAPVAPPASEITVVTSATLDDSPVAPAADDRDEGDDGSSDDKDDESATDEGSAPIAPPTPLINTRQLDANVDVIEPVSGAGNPALFGSAVDETTAQGEPQ